MQTTTMAIGSTLRWCRLGLLPLVGLACGPAPSSTTDDTGSSATTVATTTSSTTGGSTTALDGTTTVETTTAATAADSSDGTTTGPPPFWCNGSLFELTCVEEPMPMPITGTTPLGPIDLPWGYGGLVTCGTCFREQFLSRLYLLPTYEDAPADFGDDTQGLLIDLIDPAIGEARTVTVELRVGAEVISAPGQLTLDSVPDVELLTEIEGSGEPLVWTGSLVVDAEGWSIDSTFSVTGCGGAMLGIPCE